MIVGNITDMLLQEVGGIGKNCYCAVLWTVVSGVRYLGLNLSCVTRQLCDHEQGPLCFHL